MNECTFHYDRYFRLAWWATSFAHIVPRIFHQSTRFLQRIYTCWKSLDDGKYLILILLHLKLLYSIYFFLLVFLSLIIQTLAHQDHHCHHYHSIHSPIRLLLLFLLVLFKNYRIMRGQLCPTTEHSWTNCGTCKLSTSLITRSWIKVLCRAPS